jgi:hypothetical protein
MARRFSFAVIFGLCIWTVDRGLTSAQDSKSAAGPESAATAKPAHPDRAALEKSFADTLTGATLVGHFSVVGHPMPGKDLADRYEIEKAEKIEGHRWLITSRIKYGKHDLKVPIPLEVYWAGDTPVITVSSVTVPGLGTFVARVLVYGDRYAGTWQHDKFGGHMWGMIERTAAAAPSASPTPAKPKL